MKRIFFTLLITALFLSAAFAEEISVGPTKIPFYTGNMSVLPFMAYWGTHTGPITDWASPDRINLLKRNSCFADCDYQSWALAEQKPGEWDFSIYKKNADLLSEAGIKYVPFAWVHFPPKWFSEKPEFVPYVCAEHGEKLIQLSPWAPNVWDIYRKYYSEQHKVMGDKISWIRVGTPSDYGEVGYPAAMTSWLVPQKHAHAGYWCGDKYARADFQNQMQQRFHNIAKLNQRWGTAFKSWGEVTYPNLVDEEGAKIARESGKTTDRRRWLDFIDWYYNVWLRFVPKQAGIIREFYPQTKLVVSVGYSSELTKFGNDYSALPKMAKQIGISLQTPGSLSYYGLKRLSTACSFYGCPFITEPPGFVPINTEIKRIFDDASNGIQAYFDYLENMDPAREKFRDYKDFMNGALPIVDLAIFNPSIEHRLDCGSNNYPTKAFNLGQDGRDCFDFDVVDEYLIRDDVLKNYRVLVYIQGKVTEEFALRKIIDWVDDGGVLITCNLSDVETVEGNKSLWHKLIPKSGNTKYMGKGLVIKVPVLSDDRSQLISAVGHATYHLSDYGSRFTNAPLIDGINDSIAATLFPDKILYYNDTDKEITKKIKLRPRDWTNRKAQPEKMEYELKLAPHSIVAIKLKA